MNDKVLVQVRLTEEARDKLQELAGGPRKVSAFLESLALGEAQLPSKPDDHDQKPDDDQNGKYDFDADALDPLMNVLDDDLLQMVNARARLRNKEPRQIVNNGLRKMFEQYPIVEAHIDKVAPPVADDPDGGRHAHRLGKAYQGFGGSTYADCEECGRVFPLG